MDTLVSLEWTFNISKITQINTRAIYLLEFNDDTSRIVVLEFCANVSILYLLRNQDNLWSLNNVQTSEKINQFSFIIL